MLINYPFTPSAAILFRQSRASVGIVYSIPTAMNEASGDRWVLVNSIAKPLGYEHYNKLDALRHAPIELKKIETMSKQLWVKESQIHMIYQGSTGERKRLFKKLQREISALQRKKSREPAAVIPLPKSKPKPSLPLNDNAASIEYFTLQLEQAKANKAYNDETAIRANKLKQLTGSHNAPSLELIK